MSSCAFLKPVFPSKTLAAFLAENTKLPDLVWWIILKSKYDLEEKHLEILSSPSGSIHKLRSGNRYISPVDKNSLTDKFFDESYKLCNNFSNAKKSKLKGTLDHDKMIYDCLLTQMNFTMKWSHIVTLNAKKKDFMDQLLKRGIFGSITNIYNDIYKPNVISDPEYKNWCIDLVEDLLNFKDYLKCPCGWTEDVKNKCDQCMRDEQYFYHFQTLLNEYESGDNYSIFDSFSDNINYVNHTIFGSFRDYINYGNIERKPIIIQNVYCLV
jgi:hypothetical protein